MGGWVGGWVWVIYLEDEELFESGRGEEPTGEPTGRRRWVGGWVGGWVIYLEDEELFQGSGREDATGEATGLLYLGLVGRGFVIRPADEEELT